MTTEDKTPNNSSICILGGEPLKIANQIHDNRMEFDDAVAALRDEFQVRQEQLAAKHAAISDGLWTELKADLGIPEDENWSLDSTFLKDHGHAYLTPPEPKNPGAAMDALAAILNGGGATVAAH